MQEGDKKGDDAADMEKDRSEHDDNEAEGKTCEEKRMQLEASLFTNKRLSLGEYGSSIMKLKKAEARDSVHGEDEDGPLPESWSIRRVVIRNRGNNDGAGPSGRTR